jgi:catechol 2,3-dioxygenase-like lactoylglutathione lyase family enzyme
MAKIRHIALTSADPGKLADFYKDVFGMTEVRRNPNGQVFLTDGYINVALLNFKTPSDEDPGPNGGYYSGMHHIGFQVDDIEATAEKLDNAGGSRLTRTTMAGTGGLFGYGPGPSNAEVKFSGPDGVVLDMSVSGWETEIKTSTEASAH